MSGFCPKCGAWLSGDPENDGIAYCENCDETFLGDELENDEREGEG